MNAFIQNYNNEIGIYSSNTKALIKGGFASVKEARDWVNNDGVWAIVWVATTEVVKVQPVATQLVSQLTAVRNAMYGR
jgi:hypothetical protein